MSRSAPASCCSTALIPCVDDQYRLLRRDPGEHRRAAADVDGGVEVCMLRRPGRSSFAAGAFVFPGGALDEADGLGDVAYAVAGVREVLEEVGILIGGAAAGSGDAGLDERIASARSKLLNGASLGDTLTRISTRHHARGARVHRPLHHTTARGPPLRHALLRACGARTTRTFACTPPRQSRAGGTGPRQCSSSTSPRSCRRPG